MKHVIAPTAIERLLEALRVDLSDGYWLDDVGHCRPYRDAHRDLQRLERGSQNAADRCNAAGRHLQDAYSSLQQARAALAGTPVRDRVSQP